MRKNKFFIASVACLLAFGGFVFSQEEVLLDTELSKLTKSLEAASSDSQKKRC